MKNLLYILPVFLLTSCFFTATFPPEFCDISQSYIEVNNSQGEKRCGDADIKYSYNAQTQLYELQLIAYNFVETDRGNSSSASATVRFSDTKPITAGDYLNDPAKGWNYSFNWYANVVENENIETNKVSLSISGDSTITAVVRLSAEFYSGQGTEDTDMEIVFRNIKLPVVPNQ
jgi:hypothetical protein